VKEPTHPRRRVSPIEASFKDSGLVFISISSVPDLREFFWSNLGADQEWLGTRKREQATTWIDIAYFRRQTLT
jgi:hypothetical protein